MIYHQRDNKRKLKKRFSIIATFSGVFIILVVVNIFTPHIFSPFIHKAAVPLITMKNSIATSFLPSISQENKILKEKVALMEAGEVERKALADENTALKNLIEHASSSDALTSSSKKKILAEIISKPGYSPYDTLIINAGTSEGIAPGDVVLANQHIIIGEVQTVYQHSSNVVLYSTSQYKVDVFIGINAIETTAEGKGGGNFEIRLPRNADVHEGDVITLARSPSQVFGTITTITSSDADSFERVLFRSAVDVAQLRYVTLEKPLK